jgi:hypothetical protein
LTGCVDVSTARKNCDMSETVEPCSVKSKFPSRLSPDHGRSSINETDETFAQSTSGSRSAPRGTESLCPIIRLSASARCHPTISALADKLVISELPQFSAENLTALPCTDQRRQETNCRNGGGWVDRCIYLPGEATPNHLHLSVVNTSRLSNSVLAHPPTR